MNASAHLMRWPGSGRALRSVLRRSVLLLLLSVLRLRAQRPPAHSLAAAVMMMACPLLLH